LNDQVQLQDTRSLTENLTEILLSLSRLEKESSSNSSNVFGEDVNRAKCLMAAYLLPGGGCLQYILERKAFTIPIVASSTGVEINLIYSVVGRLVRGGVAYERYRVGGQGRPANLYALYDASDSQVVEAANLYRDANTEHVKRLDDYLVDHDYKEVAEEAVKYLNEEGQLGSWTLVNLLAVKRIYDDDALLEVRRIVASMGYTIVEGA